MIEYDGHGVRFPHPPDWQVHDDSDAERVAVTVESGETSFWTLAVFPDAPPPVDVLDCAATAYRDDYPGADVYPTRTRTGPQGPAVTCDIDFVCQELIAEARLTAWQVGTRTVLVLYQGSDGELEGHRDMLEAMTAGVRIAEARPTFPGLARLF